MYLPEYENAPVTATFIEFQPFAWNESQQGEAGWMRNAEGFNNLNYLTFLKVPRIACRSVALGNVRTGVGVVDSEAIISPLFALQIGLSQ